MDAWYFVQRVGLVLVAATLGYSIGEYLRQTGEQELRPCVGPITGTTSAVQELLLLGLEPGMHSMSYCTSVVGRKWCSAVITARRQDASFEVSMQADTPEEAAKQTLAKWRAVRQ